MDNYIDQFQGVLVFYYHQYISEVAHHAFSINELAELIETHVKADLLDYRRHPIVDMVIQTCIERVDWHDLARKYFEAARVPF